MVREDQSTMDGNPKEIVLKEDENPKWYGSKPQTHEQEAQPLTLKAFSNKANKHIIISNLSEEISSTMTHRTHSTCPK